MKEGSRRGEDAFPKHTGKGRRNRCSWGHHQRRDGDLDLLPGDVPPNATRGQQSSEPGAKPAAHRPETLGSPRQMASLPLPARAYPAPAPGAHQLLFALKTYLLSSSELAALPQRPSPIPRHLAPAWLLPQRQPAFVFSLCSGKGTGLVSHQAIQTGIQSHPCPFIATASGRTDLTFLGLRALIYNAECHPPHTLVMEIECTCYIAGPQ